jgi:hypothetical protein
VDTACSVLPSWVRGLPSISILRLFSYIPE